MSLINSVLDITGMRPSKLIFFHFDNSQFIITYIRMQHTYMYISYIPVSFFSLLMVYMQIISFLKVIISFWRMESVLKIPPDFFSTSCPALCI